MILVVFDLEGTLTDHRHRQHFLRQTPKDWDGWNAAAPNDEVNQAVLLTMLAHLGAGHEVEVWTGREERFRDETYSWMNWVGVPLVPLRMRPTGDRTADTDLKISWARSYRVPTIVYEDRDRMVAAWRREGITCFQVAPGDF